MRGHSFKNYFYPDLLPQGQVIKAEISQLQQNLALCSTQNKKIREIYTSCGYRMETGMPQSNLPGMTHTAAHE